ncbi:hypothetical protein [Methanobacterium oryzae]|uniref:hypothetical protein n=1 Tax=Methanobacterium oryzae TaxID=69540 RepID=UPI003D22B1DC
MKFAIWNGTAWKKQNLDYSGKSSSLALDSYNKPRISYTNLDGALRIAYWTGTQWKTQTLDQCSNSNFNGSVGENSLVLDSYNNMRISYILHYFYGEETPSFSHSELKLAIWTGSKWSKQVLDSTAPYGEEWITLGSLVLDSKNRPHINYVKSETLKYIKWTGTTWSKTALGFATGYSSLALDSAGNPHICYEGGSTLYFATKHGVDSWDIIELIDPGFIPSLVLGGIYEQPQIAYVDLINGLFRYVWFS